MATKKSAVELARDALVQSNPLGEYTIHGPGGDLDERRRLWRQIEKNMQVSFGKDCRIKERNVSARTNSFVTLYSVIVDRCQSYSQYQIWKEDQKRRERESARIAESLREQQNPSWGPIVEEFFATVSQDQELLTETHRRNFRAFMAEKKVREADQGAALVRLGQLFSTRRTENQRRNQAKIRDELRKVFRDLRDGTISTADAERISNQSYEHRNIWWEINNGRSGISLDQEAVEQDEVSRLQAALMGAVVTQA